jgi:ribonucleoside-triphosphate reductase
MGYCRPVSNFNKGKKSEYRERKFFTEGASVGHCDCAFGAAAAA